MLDELIKHKSTLLGLIAKQVLAFLVTKVPFLAFGPLSWIISQALNYYLDKLFVATIKEIEVKIAEADRIKLAEKVDALIKEYEAEPDATKKEQIETAIIDNARDLIKFNRMRSKTT
jgi:hypothetical protein